MDRARSGPVFQSPDAVLAHPRDATTEPAFADVHGRTAELRTGIWSGYVRRYFDGQFFESTQSTGE